MRIDLDFRDESLSTTSFRISSEKNWERQYIAFWKFNPLALRVLSLYPFMGTPRKATGRGRGRGGCPNPFPLAAGIFELLRHYVPPPLSYVCAQGRRLIPFCFPILPSLCVPSPYILFGDIYSIGLRETVREEFPLCRIILESCIYPSPLCGVSRIGETPKKQWFLRRGVGIYKDNPL